jgi:hypothetical protein
VYLRGEGAFVRIASPTWIDVAINPSAAPTPMVAGSPAPGELMNLAPLQTGGAPASF